VKWVTRSHVHVDRVACPWLITRFVDSAAEFLFVRIHAADVAADIDTDPIARGLEAAKNS
jgi:hypothetical protein